MKRITAVLCIAFVVCALCASGITKNDNVTGDLQKDVKKCVEIMNKRGKLSNEDSRIMEEIAAYYEAEGKAEEFEGEFMNQLLESVDALLDIDALRKAAEQGDAEAQYQLGLCYENGDGVDEDMTQAASWYRKSAEQGNADAQCNLGWCYENGEGVAEDMTQAVAWYRKSAEQGNAQGQNNLGVCYKNGESVTKDVSKAVQLFRKAAEQGNAMAQFNLGICYENGEGVAKDMIQAVAWYRKAAEQENAGAQFNLGWCYNFGEGVAKDMAQAVQWYCKAADQGDADAQCNLGWCYENGEGVAKNYEQAVALYRKAAEQGHARAQRCLGWCYEYGKGLTKDMSQAVQLYRKSAEQGDSDAQRYLAWCYLRGEGVTKDMAQAALWYRKAAEQGDARAQYYLGCCYENGEGVTTDMGQAVQWYRKAAEQGDSDAKLRIEQLGAPKAKETANKVSAATTYKMKAPVIKPNKFGFITKYDLPTKMDHLKVVATQDKDYMVTAKIYYDGKLIQTFNGLDVNAFDYSGVYYLDANFDGYVDILIGALVARNYSALLVWDKQKGKFVRVDNEMNGYIVLQPSTKMFVLSCDGGSSSNYYFRYKLTGSRMTEVDYLLKISDSKMYKGWGVKNRYTLYKNNRITSSTSLESKLPQEWQYILKSYRAANDYRISHGLKYFVSEVK